MRGPLQVAAAQPACVPDDVATNARRHATAIRAAAAQVVVFPELSMTGYQLDTPALSIDDPAFGVLREACAASGSVALVGAPVREAGRDHIATVCVSPSGVHVAYRKNWLGAEESVRFSAGSEPASVTVAGWRLGLAICKDTGVADHTTNLERLGVDAYLAGVVHHPEELAEQDARGVAISRRLGVPVVFASAAGAVGDDYPRTAGTSTVWSPAGDVLARASAVPGDIVRALLGGSAGCRGGDATAVVHPVWTTPASAAPCSESHPDRAVWLP